MTSYQYNKSTDHAVRDYGGLVMITFNKNNIYIYMLGGGGETALVCFSVFNFGGIRTVNIDRM